MESPDSSEKKRRRLPLRKRILFMTVLLCLVVGLCELVSYSVLALTSHEFSMQQLRYRQDQIASGSSASDGAAETIHPYLGWVHNPQLSQPESFSDREIPVNWLGFKDDGNSVYHRADDLFIIGIAGGSVAWRFSWEAEEVLRETLVQHPSVKGRRIQFVRMALPGYKQPQQVMAFSFLLSLGAEFDAIINLDGFNEAALTLRENAISNTSVVYPRSWHTRTISMVDPQISADAFRLLQLRGQRQQMAASMRSSRFQWSPTLNLIWHVRDRSAHEELTDLGFHVSANRRTSFVHHGPGNQLTGDALDKEVAAVWKRCSLQLHHQCRATGTLYLHVLQPNQYVLNSKPLNATELQMSYSEDEGTAAVVRNVFPELLRESEDLIKRGVEFSDQTMAFSGVEDTLYVDPWCHFNAAGNRILGTAVAARLLKMLDKKKSDSTSDVQ